ncbi:ATP-binding cassette domain-containing protein [uncultured Acetatifactor sp.]|uniref:ABC transporter ATP-binding protein n=1 Tax=uncultured Acetatifactor sp. TaxID=1671927 RepID=UPI002622EA59|nr:ATP-binding cassette domain-containing protein [uncultured Acetatifactor sp.]
MVIQATGLTKDYIINLKGKGLKGMAKSLFRSEKKTVHAVQDVDLTMDEGELVGYIGPNGAGKSTTIKMLSGILAPTAGTVRVCGIDPQKRRIQNALNIGAVFGQKTQLWWDLPVRETFELLRRMYNIPADRYKKNVDEFMDFLDMGPFADQAVRQLSLGQRMRAEIAASLLHDPKVLFLDEPTIGLDVNVKVAVRDFVRKINKERGVTILLTTHDLQDIEELARRIVVINHGQVGFDGSQAQLAERYADGKRSVSFTLQQEASQIVLPEGLAGHCTLQQEGLHVKVIHDSRVSSSDLIVALVQRYRLTDIDIKGPQIEDVVMEVYKS